MPMSLTDLECQGDGVKVSLLESSGILGEVGVLGPPVLFGSDLFTRDVLDPLVALQELSGDTKEAVRGGRVAEISAHRAELIGLEFWIVFLLSWFS